MKLLLIGHAYRYAVEQMLLVLFPQQRPEYIEAVPAERENLLISVLETAEDRVVGRAELFLNGAAAVREESLPASVLTEEPLERDRLLQRILKLSFFHAAAELTGTMPPWGALTGIRPAKLASKALEAGSSEDEVRDLFRNTYCVSPERTELALDAAGAGLRAKRSLRPDELSVYVGIPFCPTRCSYCSFVSADVGHARRVLPDFLRCLEEEIGTVGALLPQAGSVPRTLYIGGGTPTVLTADQLDRLLGCLRGALDLSRCTEFTVEAGRPDTITADRLAVLKARGVTRISVNPQTLRDGVLEAMGRSHTAADVFRAYRLARDAGFGAVNMDLIAGLPKDDPAGFRYTLDGVLDLAPENITVHTLALKKGARLTLEQSALPDGGAVTEMLEYAWARLRQAGYQPYYLYRQKYMSGSLENIGWCRPGFEGLYNICIMEAYHTILALGGGGSTKLTDPKTGRIERLTNPKYPYEYIRDIETIKADKARLVPFQRHLAERDAEQDASRA